MTRKYVRDSQGQFATTGGRASKATGNTAKAIKGSTGGKTGGPSKAGAAIKAIADIVGVFG